MSEEREFCNTTGEELLQLLDRRVDEALPRDADRISAYLGAALVLLASVLGRTIETADDPKVAADKMIDLSVRWLRELLQPVIGTR